MFMAVYSSLISLSSRYPGGPEKQRRANDFGKKERRPTVSGRAPPV